jgi:hypothetical protein
MLTRSAASQVHEAPPAFANENKDEQFHDELESSITVEPLSVYESNATYTLSPAAEKVADSTVGAGSGALDDSIATSVLVSSYSSALAPVTVNVTVSALTLTSSSAYK